ncbi:MAG: endonuclease domain-containing protein [Micrococcales bacterium]|nr:endonuclease domain-containing protein [Micrococcales bacterium]
MAPRGAGTDSKNGYPQAAAAVKAPPLAFGHYVPMEHRAQTIVGSQTPAIAHSQAGLFTRAQALEDGFTRGQVAYRLKKRLWVPFAGFALGPAGLPRTAERGGWSAWLTWPDAVVCGAIALMMQLPNLPLAGINWVDCAVATSRRPKPGLLAHRRGLAEGESRRAAGGFLQNVAWALVDTLASLEPKRADELFAWAVTRKVITAAQFSEALAARARRPGVVKLRRYLEWIELGVASILEFLVVKTLKEEGFTGFEVNATIRVGGRGIMVDILFRRQKVVVEADGWRYHSSAEAFENDRDRLDAMTASGFRVLQVTWQMITQDPGLFVARLRSTLRQADQAAQTTQAA